MPLKGKIMIGTKIIILNNLDDHIGYKGQEVEIIEELENDYYTVTDGLSKWCVGIEETNIG